MFFFKQLADVVESVTGAATVACGLNLTQDYLYSINVLKFKQEHLYHKLKELKRSQEQELQALREKVKAKEAGKAAAVAAAGN